MSALCLLAGLISAGTVWSTEALRLVVPFFEQTEYQCGPSALAAVLNYWGDDITPEEIGGTVFSSGARGTLTLDLLLFARGRGVEAVQRNSTLDAIRDELRASRPVVLLVDEGFWFIRQGHYLVVTGFDAGGFYVHDGRTRDRYVQTGKLLRKWERTGQWAMFVKGSDST